MLPAIHTLVPHAATMLLLDRVVAADENHLYAEVVIRCNSTFYQEAEQSVGAWIGVEYMAQAIAAFAGYNAQRKGEAVKVGLLLGTRRYACNCTSFALGDVLQIHVHCLLQADNGLGSFECSIERAGERLASATLNVFQPKDLTQFLEGNHAE